METNTHPKSNSWSAEEARSRCILDAPPSSGSPDEIQSATLNRNETDVLTVPVDGVLREQRSDLADVFSVQVSPGRRPLYGR